MEPADRGVPARRIAAVVLPALHLACAAPPLAHTAFLISRFNRSR